MTRHRQSGAAFRHVCQGPRYAVRLRFRAEKGAAEALYALDNLPNKILAAEYQAGVTR